MSADPRAAALESAAPRNREELSYRMPIDGEASRGGFMRADEEGLATLRKHTGNERRLNRSRHKSCSKSMQARRLSW